MAAWSWSCLVIAASPFTGTDKRSRLQWLKNGVPQGSVVAPLLFYISDLQTAISTKYAYANNLAIMHDDGDWQTVEGVLSEDVTNRREIPPYLEVKAQYYKSSVGSLPPQQQAVTDLHIGHGLGPRAALSYDDSILTKNLQNYAED